MNHKEYTNGTLQIYQTTINCLLDYFHPDTSVQHIKQEHAEEFIAQLDYVRKDLEGSGEELSDSARNIRLRSCKKIFSTAVQWKYIIENPFSDIKQVTPVTQPWHRITVEEFDRILEHTNELRNKVFYALQYGCGLRSGEALNLLNNGTNVDLRNKQIHLKSRPGTQTIPPFILKDKEARSIPIPKKTLNLLKQYEKERDPDCPFLLMTMKRWQVVQQN